MSGLVLGIDTTGKGGAVALVEEGHLLGVRVHDPRLGYAEELFGLLDALLLAAGRTREQLESVAVLEGPGSFTGLRIGVMTAKAVAFARQIPLFAAPTLDIVAAAAGDGRWNAIADAGGGHVWVREVEVDGDRVQGHTPVLRSPRAEVDAATLPVACAVPLVPAEGQCLVTDLAAEIALRAARGARPLREVDPQSLVPDYVSVSQAERVHGVDLSEELDRPIEPRGWER